MTDWPGYFPNGPEVVRLLVVAGADPDARYPGEETPLHWAASSDDSHVALGEAPSQERLSQAFWHARSGGQRRAAEYLLASGADPNWVPSYAKGTPLDAVTGLGTQRDNLIGWLREHGAHCADPDR